MLIRFSVSNFLSFDNTQELSMEAGKARKFSERIYANRRLKLVKCEALFGANASGKSNFIEAFQFIQDMVMGGFPRGFTNKYYRLNTENREKPSTFELELLCNDKRLCFGFSTILNKGCVVEEWLYEITASGLKKFLYKRDVMNEAFEVGSYFKTKDVVNKLNNYGEDSSADQESLFLTIINQGKSKMFSDYPELEVLNDLYTWFRSGLNISTPDGVLTKYPYFQNSQLESIAEILNALGTGISDIRYVSIPLETVQQRLPEPLYQNIISQLEKDNIKAKKAEPYHAPGIFARGYKEFYVFDIDIEDRITVQTIEFCHETDNVYFGFQEESDGTARLLDLIEILSDNSRECVYVIDEIDRCLHPAATTKIIRLFLELAKKRNTQLIITTHESRLLKEEILRNDEISFMIKTSNGSTIIKSLEKYSLRADKRVYEALFDGTLDVLPQFKDEQMTATLETMKS